MAGGITFKTISEQRLEYLEAQRRIRRLTDDEWAAMTRCEHAVYERNRRRMAAV